MSMPGRGLPAKRTGDTFAIMKTHGLMGGQVIADVYDAGFTRAPASLRCRSPKSMRISASGISQAARDKVR
jgi:hypothetical protein